MMYMFDLTQRQIEILKQIIREYVDTAEPVGSETLEKKYDVGVSPATIRNEMAEMVKLGYLAKPHSSSGRIPTSKALKFYVTELMREKDLSVAEEVKAKEEVWDLRTDHDKFLREITKNLAQKTHTLAVTATFDGNIYYAGYSHILEMPEFYDIDVTKNLLSLLDDFSYFSRVFQKIESECSVLLGEELGEQILFPYGFVFAKFHTRSNRDGSIGIVGPTRLHYEAIVPMVRYFGTLIEEVADW